MRIDKILSNIGYGSRKEVKKLLKSGAVKVNERLIKDPKEQVDPDAENVTVHGERVEYREFIYLMMNKPPGVLSAITTTSYFKLITTLSFSVPSLYSKSPSDCECRKKGIICLCIIFENDKLECSFL